MFRLDQEATQVARSRRMVDACRFPALWLSPDASPTHAVKAWADGNAVMSGLISARIAAVAVRSIQGMIRRVSRSGSTERQSSDQVPCRTGTHPCSLGGDRGPLGSIIMHDRNAGHRFRNELVMAAVVLIMQRWKPDPAPAWLTCVSSSHRRPCLVSDVV